jgi:glutamate dehydrogenase (NAD(P)+)
MLDETIMFTTDTAPAGRAISFGDLDHEAEWERAAKLLDLDPDIVRRLRHPQWECVSRHECSAGELSGAASLFIAMARPNRGESVASLAVSGQVSASSIAAAAQELRLQASLLEVAQDTAAIGLQLPSTIIDEQELWQLSRDCAPIVSRFLGEVQLLPADVASAAFANWMASVAAQFGGKLRAPAMRPEEYGSTLDEMIAESIVAMSALELEEIGKNLRGATAAVVGGGHIARRCMQLFQEAGMRIVAAADESGAVVESAGIETAPMFLHLDAGGLLVEYPDVQHALHSDAISMAADILLLESHGAEITEGNAASVQAPVVVEASAGNLTCATTQALSDRGVTVIPSHVTQCLRVLPDLGSSRARWLRKERAEKMRQRLGQLWNDLSELRKRHQLPLPRAALVLGLQRLAEVERATHP